MVEKVQDGFVDWIKWLIPLLLSVAVFLRSIAEARRAKRDSSSRARQQYNSELRSWAKECIEILSELNQVLRSPSAGGLQDIQRLSWGLSAKADQGRFFFPNLFDTEHGQSKEPAFRGLRPRVLDWLVYAFRVSCSVYTLADIDAAKIIVNLKRGFTADMQLALNPRNLASSLEEFQQLLSGSEFMEVSQSHSTLVETNKFIEKRKLSQLDTERPS